MDNPLSGWQIGLSEFKAADRDYMPVTSEALADVVMAQVGVKLEWTEDAENGIYGVTLTNSLHQLLTTKGFINFEFRTRDGVFKITAEADVDKL